MSFTFPIRILQLFNLLTKTASKENEKLEGEIVDVIKPHQEWRIKFRASYWTARAITPANFQPGDRVRIVGYKTSGHRISNTLLIEYLID